ncbi:MAG: hypothetical protein AAGJ46_09795 [Planctomycetota bacterium]
MNTTASQTGVTVWFYLPRLTTDELELLTSWGLKAAERSERLGHWLADVCMAEQTRRLTLNAAKPAEADLPAIPLAEWSDSELADAMLTANALCYSAPRTLTAADFIDRVAWTINAACASRLKENPCR